MAFGPPPGLPFPDETVGNPALANHGQHGYGSGPSTGMEVSQSGSTHGESVFSRLAGWESQVSVPSCRAFSAETVSSALI